MFLRMAIACLLIMVFTSVPSAQSIRLQKSNKVEVLDSTSKWIVLEKFDGSTKCCNSNRVTGKIYSVTSDSITIIMNRLQVSFKNDDRMIWSDEKYLTDDLPRHTMAKSDIQYLQKDGNSDLKKGIKYIGGALLLTGIATGIHSLIVEPEDRSALLISTGIQLGVSLSLIAIGNSKNEYKIHESAWQF